MCTGGHVSALASAEVQGALDRAKSYRGALEVAQRHERTATVTYIDAALAAGWTWERIGEGLGVSGTGARRYYQRNRRRVRSV